MAAEELEACLTALSVKNPSHKTTASSNLIVGSTSAPLRNVLIVLPLSIPPTISTLPWVKLSLLTQAAARATRAPTRLRLIDVPFDIKFIILGLIEEHQRAVGAHIGLRTVKRSGQAAFLMAVKCGFLPSMAIAIDLFKKGSEDTWENLMKTRKDRLVTASNNVFVLNSMVAILNQASKPDLSDPLHATSLSSFDRRFGTTLKLRNMAIRLRDIMVELKKIAPDLAVEIVHVEPYT